jgi:hypothetical protein
MTDLYDRLFPQFPPEVKGKKIAHSIFAAALQDNLDGWASRESIVLSFGLDKRAAKDLDAVLHALEKGGAAWLASFQAVCFLVEANRNYANKKDFKLRLGLD